jgi:hypothetical protein
VALLQSTYSTDCFVMQLIQCIDDLIHVCTPSSRSKPPGGEEAAGT